MKNRWTIISVIIISVLLLIQLFPGGRTNPPVTGEIQPAAEISKILQKSCYDCHSHQTQWPWYSRIAPSSWLVIHDVNEGREHLNFSIWNTYTSREKIKIYEEIREVLEKEEMPLKPYLWMHSKARLSEEDLQNLFQWITLSPSDTL
jgi:hypothetical protein